MNFVKTLKRAVLLLSLLSLMGSAGVVPLCASCGPKLMDCCKGNSSGAVSLNLAPCCDFHMSVTVEPHPARMTSVDSRNLQDEAPLVSAWDVTHPSVDARLPERFAPSAGPPLDISPPLFLKNSSFLC